MDISIKAQFTPHHHYTLPNTATIKIEWLIRAEESQSCYLMELQLSVRATFITSVALWGGRWLLRVIRNQKI